MQPDVIHAPFGPDMVLFVVLVRILYVWINSFRALKFYEKNGEGKCWLLLRRSDANAQLLPSLV